MPLWTIKYSPIWRVIYSTVNCIQRFIFANGNLNTHIHPSNKRVNWLNRAFISSPNRLLVKAINYTRHTTHQNSLQITTDRVTATGSCLLPTALSSSGDNIYASEGNTGAYLIVSNGSASCSRYAWFPPRKYVRSPIGQPRRTTIRGFPNQGAGQYEKGRCQT